MPDFFQSTDFDFFALIPQIFLAYIQAILIIGGVISIAIGGLVFFAEVIGTSNDSTMKKAKIIGVRQGSTTSTNGRSRSVIYYPVFEYVDERGNRVEAESSSGSNILTNKIPGTYVMVRINPNNPEWVSPSGAVWKIISFVLITLGISLIGGSLYNAEYSNVTYIVWLFVVLQMAFKFRKVLWIPKKFRETKEQFMSRKNTERDDARKKLPFLGEREIRELLRQQDRMLQYSFPITLLIACGVIYGGYYFYDKEQQVIRDAQIVMGTYGEGNRSNSYLTFHTEDGKSISIYDKFVDFYPSTRGAKQAEVYYRPKDPYNAVINRGVWQGLYFKALMGFGLFIMLQSFVTYFKSRRRLSRI